MSLDFVSTKTAMPITRGTDVLLSLEDVSLSYEDSGGESNQPVVSHLNLQIREGKLTLFLGPSGCGKSTVAMLCAGLIPSSIEGTVTGQVWRHEALQQPGSIGYVFQNPDSQFCMLTAADEIAFGLENQRLHRADMPPRIRTALDLVRLDVAWDANHDTFSGGMKQKLAIACAEALEAKLLILDEPTANLDPASTRLVFSQIADLRAQNRTMLVIEHKFDGLLPFVDEVVLFSPAGEIVATGSPREILASHWQWMIDIGVVAPWKQPPAWIQTPSSPHIVTAPVGHAVPARTAEVDAFRLTAGDLRYKQTTVWKNLNLSIPKGSFTAIVGPNGAGKSSLLQVLAGLQKLNAGALNAFGELFDTRKHNAQSKQIAYGFQNPELQFIYDRVGDELANRIVDTAVPADVLELLAEYGLDGLAAQSPFSLSQGQKRRLSVAVMLRNDRAAYLLDEPTFGQDARTQQAILDKLSGLQEAGKTVVIVTHDMDLVRRYATHVIVLAEGGVLFEGTATAVFAQPDVLSRAHLLDDVTMLEKEQVGMSARLPAESEASKVEVSTSGHTNLLTRLNPAWLLVTVIVTIGIGVGARNLNQALAVFVLPVVYMLVLARMSPWWVAKRLSLFFVFYLFYVWSLTAYGKVTPGMPTFHLLWMTLSWTGFDNGIVLMFRMVGAVAFGLLFIASMDLTELVVALCKNFHLAPKFAYGVLAGLRFFPSFQTEWTKLRQARKLRGKDSRWVILRPAMYGLPILSQAIRLSERVAIAMEARGFVGLPASSSTARTFYRNVQVRARDFVFLVVTVVLVVLSLIVFSIS